MLHVDWDTDRDPDYQERNWPRIHALDPRKFDERFRRIWRTYLYSCAEMFRSAHARTYLFQIVYSKGNLRSDAYPMSRAFLYAGDRAAADSVRAAAPAGEPA